MATVAAQRKARGSGFTLVEVMISLVILAFGLLAMIAVQAQALRDGSRGRHTSAAAMIARDQLEQVEGMPYSSAQLQPIAWTAAPWISIGALPVGQVPVIVSRPGSTETEMVYSVSYRIVADPGGNPDLRNVDLDVTWTEDGISNNRPTRTGLPTVSLSTVLVNNDL